MTSAVITVLIERTFSDTSIFVFASRLLSSGSSSGLNTCRLINPFAIPPSDSAIAGSAETNWAFVDYEKQTPTRIPPEVASSFEIVGEK